jgi:adenine-specific DNA-methyltransferase
VAFRPPITHYARGDAAGTPSPIGPEPSQRVKSPKPVGRLELTWTNKHLRLLAHEDGSYEWVEPSDHRVAEVRLLRDAGRVGEDPESGGPENLLIRGDALHALLSLSWLPEYQEKYAGKVRLVYIDPPFNTQQSFLQYDDALEHSVWLTMMRDRLVQARNLLAEDGTLWLHLDDAEQHRGRQVLDEVFGANNFVATFLWQKVDSPNDNKVAVTPDHEFIHCYARDLEKAYLVPMPDPSILAAYGSTAEDGRRYRDRLLKKSGKNSLRGDRPTMFFPVTDPDGKELLPIHDDGREAVWALGQEAVDALVRSGQLVWKKQPTPDRTGERWRPYTREWAPDNPKRPWPTIWTDLHTTRQTKAHHRALFPGTTVFATPKPENLLRRILEIGTRPGDLVVDFFAGSGTTAAVAHKMDRRWIAVERSELTLSTYMMPRLRMVVQGEDPGGITPTVGWDGGGAFRILDVSPSMFAEVTEVVLLAEWATAGSLAEVVAAQLGFSHDPQLAPFCGHQGRCRIAVIDGRVNESVVALLSGLLRDNETMLICATSLDPAAREVLPRGSRLQKIPSSILDQYRRQYRTRRRSELGIESAQEPTTEPLGANA